MIRFLIHLFSVSTEDEAALEVPVAQDQGACLEDLHPVDTDHLPCLQT